MSTTDNAKRLGELVRQRRRELRLTQADVQERGGPSTATLRLIEGGRHTDFRQSTAGPLERALEWAPATIATILAGGDPTVAPGGTHVVQPPAMQATITQPRSAAHVAGADVGTGSDSGTARIVSREYRLLTAQLEVTEALLDAIEVAESTVEVEYAHRYLEFADKMLELVGQGTPLVSDDEADTVNARTRRVSERYGAQRLRLGLPVGVDSTTPPAVAEGQWNAAARVINQLTDESIERAKDHAETDYRAAERDLRNFEASASYDDYQSDHALARRISDEPKGPDPRGLDDGEE